MEKDTTNRNLGLKKHTCRICGHEGMVQSYLVREMMQGTKDEFEYFLCPECLCLQIHEIPEDLGKYYGQDYYSMTYTHEPDSKFINPVTIHEKILDVGCGIGAWLYEEAYAGHDNLFGCDPFLDHDIEYGNRVHIYKRDILQMDGDGTYDGIRMSDSFEHVTNPREVLEKAEKLIKADGTIMMTIPIYPNIAFDLFETHWYQLDAPRHIFLHSLQSIQYLCNETGLRIHNIQYNSNESQIIRSFFYQHGVSYYNINSELVRQYFSNTDMDRITKMTEEANKNNKGDHVAIWLKKK